MATIVKAATGTALATGASWTGGVTPGTTDTAQWSSTSLGAGLTGNLSVAGVLINGALTNIGVTTSTWTIGAGGIDMRNGGAGTTTLLSIPTLLVDSNQTIYFGANGNVSANITLTGALNSTGTKTLTLANPLGYTSPALYLSTAAGSNFNGTILLTGGSSIGVGTATALSSSATVQGGQSGVSADAGWIFYTTGASTSTPAPISVYQNGQIGYPGRTATFSGGVTFNATVTQTLDGTTNLSGTVALGANAVSFSTPSGASATLSGVVSGTNGFNKEGVGGLTFSNASNTVSGNLGLNAGTFTAGATAAIASCYVVPGGGTLAGTVNIRGMTGSGAFTNSGAVTLPDSTSWTFAGTMGAGVGTIVKNGTAVWTMSGTGTGTKTSGATTISNGVLAFLTAGSQQQFGTAPLTVTAGGTIRLSGGALVAHSSSAVSLAGAGYTGEGGAIHSVSGTNSFSGASFALTANATVIVDAGQLTLASAGAITGGFNFTKAGAGTLVLTQTNSSFSGVLSITGTLSFSTVANGLVASGIGAASNAASNIVLASGATLQYTGAAGSTDRAFQVPAAGATLDGSGTGALTWGGAPTGTATNTAYALTLAGSASSGTNALSGALADNGTGAATLTNTGSWKLTGAASLTGALTASTGTLEVAPTTGANSMSGTAAAVTSGATLKLTTEAAVETPATGRVLGTKPVNVSGTLQTSTGTLQRGRMRYGGSVTFASGSTLRIGG